MKVTLKVSVGAGSQPALFYIDTLDLYHGRSRVSFIEQAAKALQIEPGILNREINLLIESLEKLRLKLIEEAKNPKPKSSHSPSRSEVRIKGDYTEEDNKKKEDQNTVNNFINFINNKEFSNS
jgi:hypothetical protein